MNLVLYGIIFWTCAIIYIVLEWKSMTGTPFTTMLKAIPAFSAVLYVLLFANLAGIFSLLLLTALAFCGMGDIAMEYDILSGLGLFLISHILYTANFIFHALRNLTLTSIGAFVASLSAMMVYVGVFHRYIRSAEEPTELLPAVDLYALLISLTLSSSVMLWFSANILLGVLPIIGAIFFIISDSLIGVREFHHRFQYDEPVTMITYYLAIFLLSTAAFTYGF